MISWTLLDFQMQCLLHMTLEEYSHVLVEMFCPLICTRMLSRPNEGWRHARPCGRMACAPPKCSVHSAARPGARPRGGDPSRRAPARRHTDAPWPTATAPPASARPGRAALLRCAPLPAPRTASRAAPSTGSPTREIGRSLLRDYKRTSRDRDLIHILL